MNQIVAAPQAAPSAELTPAPSRDGAPCGTTMAGTLLNFVARAMTDPGINVDKLEVLLRMQREIVADDARLQFHRAMSATQAEMQPVLRDATNTQTQSKYARLETIDARLRPVYTRHGFCLSFDQVPVDGPNVRIVCEVSHAAGHSKSYHLEAALDMAGPQGKANKTPLHGLGSSLTYLRRYLTTMIFHVVLTNEDNDGNQTREDVRTARPSEITGRTAIDELAGRIAECSADPTATAANERAFLSKMGLGDLRSIAGVRPAEFPRLKNALLTKKAVLAQRGAAARPARETAEREGAEQARQDAKESRRILAAEQARRAVEVAAARQPSNGDAR